MPNDEARESFEQVEIELNMLRAELDHERGKTIPFLSNDAYEQGEKVGQLESAVMYLELWVEHCQTVLLPMAGKMEESDRSSTPKSYSLLTLINILICCVNVVVFLQLVRAL